MLQKLLLPAVVLLLSACVKDRLVPGRNVQPAGVIEIGPGVLRINEFVCTGSTNINEFGTAEDWFEIYNPSASPLLLEGGKWHVSDGGPANPTKYELPEVTIPGRGFLVVWCDNQNVVGDQVHTNFALSSAGEHLVIHYTHGGEGMLVDDHLYSAQNVAGASFGRTPDGEENWVLFATPTPGSSNQ